VIAIVTYNAAHFTFRALMQVDDFVEAEADNLRAKAEEGKAELDKLADLQNLRAEVAFNSALAGEGWGGAGQSSVHKLPA
jgi:hypothetical protein